MISHGENKWEMIENGLETLLAMLLVFREYATDKEVIGGLDERRDKIIRCKSTCH